MAQTTTATSARNARIAVSTDGTNYTDISGTTNQFSPGDGSRMTGELHTFDGDGPIIVAGKLEAQESTFVVAYTETAGEAYALTQAAFAAANSTLYARVDPLGSTAGNFRFISSKGVVTQFPYFGDMDASSGDVQSIEGTFRHGGWSKGVVP